jgi:hypothetical protein
MTTPKKSAVTSISPARVTRDAVYIGGEKVPGAIEAGGVVVKPGGHKSINRLTITFLVSDVEIVDSMVDE